jgi:HD superfamily phosphodiesterase
MDLADEPAPAPCPGLAGAAAWFEDFTAGHIARAGDHAGPMRMKVAHTRRVVGHALRIAQTLELAEPLRHGVALAALLHDAGRFPQFLRWRTFRDAESANHGRLGAQILRDCPALAGEPAATRRAVLVAVAMHNRYALPAALPEPARLITNIVRDADKIDILHVIARELDREEPSGEVVLSAARESGKWTPELAGRVLSGVVPDYKDIVYLNDFIILLGSWTGALNFSISLRLIRQDGSLERLMRMLPDHPQLDAVRRWVLSRLYAEKGGGQGPNGADE